MGVINSVLSNAGLANFTGNAVPAVTQNASVASSSLAPLASGINSALGLPNTGALTSGLTGSNSSSGTTSILQEISAFFLRAVIIILGFIFIAVGLGMFKQPAIISQTTEGFARIGRGVRKAVGGHSE